MRLLKKVFYGAVIAVVVIAAVEAVRMRTPVTAFRREIVVNAPREVAWDHFSRPLEWKSWLGADNAPTSLQPGEVIGPDTVASFGSLVTFRMAEFDPPNHWMWAGRMLWFTARYDHQFEQVAERRTRMVFQMQITGFGNDLFARLVGAATTAGGHQEALNRLGAEINQLPAAASGG